MQDEEDLITAENDDEQVSSTVYDELARIADINTHDGVVTASPERAEEISEAQIARLFTDQDLVPIFRELAEGKIEPPMAELTAAYLMRAEYLNGSSPPRYIAADGQLGQMILSLDTTTIDDPVERDVFSLFQTALTDPSTSEQLDHGATACRLLPGLIRKHSPEVATAMLEKFGSYTVDDYSRDVRTISGIGIDAITAAREVATAVGVVEQPEPAPPEVVAYNRLVLLLAARETVDNFKQELAEQGHSQELDQFTAISSELREQVSTMLVAEFGASEEEAGIALDLLTENGVTKYGIVLDHIDGYGVATILELAKDAELREAIIKLTKTELTSRLARQVVMLAIDELGDSDKLGRDRLIGASNVLSGPDIQPLIDRLKLADQDRLIVQILSKQDPVEYMNELKAAVNDLALDAFLTRIEEPKLVSTQLRDKITEQLISSPKRFGDLIATLATDPKLHRLVTDPSIATADFLKIIQGAMLGDQDLIIKAGSGIIAENYAQASKLMNPSQIWYYTAPVSSFLQIIDSIAARPVLLAAYRSFLERAGPMSSESEQRAASLFKTLKYLGEEDIGDMTNLDEIEGGIVASFLTKLSDGQVNVSPEQQRAFIEGFGTLTPILIYALNYIGQDEYKKALSGLVESVASGTYETWKRGDGSVESLRELVEAGYLPENLTPEQYVEWCTDRRADTREQMVSSAEDTAFAIRDVVANGSIDIAMLAPGYSVKLEDLQVVNADRKGLGQLIAALHKVAKGQTEGIFSANLLNELESSLGEAGITSGVADVLKMLKDGANIAEVKRAVEIKLTQLKQLSLLIRVANISPEEVASGALLKEPDKNGVRKIQQQLDDVISTLTEDLPPAIAFIPQSVKQILTDSLAQNDKIELFEVEDTIDPKVTLEIGETPQRTCQHYESGGYRAGLIGYYDPEVKIIIVRNENGGIIGRSIMRLMQDENGDAILFIERIYLSVSSPTVRTMIEEHASKKAAEMGIELRSNIRGFGSRLSDKPRTMIVRKLKMPAVYTDSGGINRGSMKIVS